MTDTHAFHPITRAEVLAVAKSAGIGDELALHAFRVLPPADVDPMHEKGRLALRAAIVDDALLCRRIEGTRVLRTEPTAKVHLALDPEELYALTTALERFVYLDRALEGMHVLPADRFLGETGRATLTLLGAKLKRELPQTFSVEHGPTIVARDHVVNDDLTMSPAPGVGPTIIPAQALPNDTRTAEELDAHLRAKGIRAVLTTLTPHGAHVEAFVEGSRTLTASGPTSSHAFDALLGKLEP